MGNIRYDLKPVCRKYSSASDSEELVFLTNVLFIWEWKWSLSFIRSFCATCLKQHLFQGMANVWHLNGIHSIGQNLDCQTLTSALQETLTPSSAAGNGLYSVSKANKKFLDLLICTKGRVSTADILKQI